MSALLTVLTSAQAVQLWQVCPMLCVLRLWLIIQLKRYPQPTHLITFLLSMSFTGGEFGTSAVRLSQLLPWVSHGLGPRQTFSRGTQVGFSVVRSLPEHTGTSFLKRDLLWPRLEVFPRPCHSLSCGGSGVTFPPVLQSSVLTQQV